MTKYSRVIFCLSLIPCFSALAADGQIRFIGSIIPTACKVDSSSINQVVNLGNISVSSFNGKSSTSAPTAFNIKLTNCPAEYKKVKIKFDGYRDTNNPDYLSIMAADPRKAAQGIGIAIYEGNNIQMLPLNQDIVNKALDGQHEIDIPLVAKYIATTDKVTPGTAEALIHFSVIYD